MGKTMVVQDVVAWLRGRGHRVGGFSIRPAYGRDTDAPVAYYAHLYATDRLIRLSHHDLRADEALDLGKYRPDTVRTPTQNISDHAVHETLEALATDHQDPAIDAIVLDELGGILAATAKRKHRRAEDLPNLTERLVTDPKPTTIIVALSKRSWEEANIAEARLAAALPTFPGRIATYELRHGGTPMAQAARILQTLG
jgi:nucleoside-triphosphatase THEP1